MTALRSRSHSSCALSSSSSWSCSSTTGATSGAGGVTGEGPSSPVLRMAAIRRR
eukprot:CAMPEP_0170156882 /NCGR_PEP_ID=MMETSP0033_2-20121228/64384_1 /TAXON_ID=195969 /ORGANISM="Dolichomastix tenuilepis, Strain CCMP3274" /LENGTH=53 /DNA_ID=CAMNT_0010394255 /DNA_START=31 /DNA_END=189 /DNA_ORIENTATION=+